MLEPKESNNVSKSFQELGVSAPVSRVLESAGFTHPFSIQNAVQPDALAGLDILAESPTGSGKTLAFGLPLVERTAGSNARPGALVLVPTRELALQVTSDLRPLAKAKGLRIETVYGGAPIGAQIKKAREAHVLVATPGRLHDLIERRAVKLNDVRVLVLDEADRMLDMGFKPQVDRILRSVPANRQTMLFSATFDGAVAELARAYTVNAVHVRGELPAEAERGEIAHSFVPVTADDKLERLVEQLNADRGLALVFVRTKHGADKLARKLERQHDIRAVAMHGNLSQNQRERALANFESGRVTTLVATDVAARGLDVDDITHVINFDPPQGDNDYVHRVGRTGRAGRSGNGVTLVLPDQRNDVGRLATRLGHGEQFASSGMAVATKPRPAGSGSSGQRRRRRR
ncbi:MAG TPA: DEAD/DEAH box helicase [Gaiellaceae bacterium]|nr:DEAD/DEAH box helicase [Gaiellaceae bacterium]